MANIRALYSDPRFKMLDDQGKAKAIERFFQLEVAADPRYANGSNEVRNEAKIRFIKLSVTPYIKGLNLNLAYTAPVTPPRKTSATNNLWEIPEELKGQTAPKPKNLRRGNAPTYLLKTQQPEIPVVYANEDAKPWKVRILEYQRKQFKEQEQYRLVNNEVINKHQHLNELSNTIREDIRKLKGVRSFTGPNAFAEAQKRQKKIESLQRALGNIEAQMQPANERDPLRRQLLQKHVTNIRIADNEKLIAEKTALIEAEAKSETGKFDADKYKALVRSKNNLISWNEQLKTGKSPETRLGIDIGKDIGRIPVIGTIAALTAGAIDLIANNLVSAGLETRGSRFAQGIREGVMSVPEERMRKALQSGDMAGWIGNYIDKSVRSALFSAPSVAAMFIPGIGPAAAVPMANQIASGYMNEIMSKGYWTDAEFDTLVLKTAVQTVLEYYTTNAQLKITGLVKREGRAVASQMLQRELNKTIQTRMRDIPRIFHQAGKAGAMENAAQYLSDTVIDAATGNTPMPSLDQILVGVTDNYVQGYIGEGLMGAAGGITAQSVMQQSWANVENYANDTNEMNDPATLRLRKLSRETLDIRDNIENEDYDYARERLAGISNDPGLGRVRNASVNRALSVLQQAADTGAATIESEQRAEYLRALKLLLRSHNKKAKREISETTEGSAEGAPMETETQSMLGNAEQAAAESAGGETTAREREIVAEINTLSQQPQSEERDRRITELITEIDELEAQAANNATIPAQTTTPVNAIEQLKTEIDRNQRALSVAVKARDVLAEQGKDTSEWDDIIEQSRTAINNAEKEIGYQSRSPEVIKNEIDRAESQVAVLEKIQEANKQRGEESTSDAIDIRNKRLEIAKLKDELAQHPYLNKEAANAQENVSRGNEAVPQEGEVHQGSEVNRLRNSEQGRAVGEQKQQKEAPKEEVRPPATPVTYTPEQQNRVDETNRLGKLFRVKVKYFDAAPNINGWHAKDGTIHININGGKTQYFAFGHEFTHHLEENNKPLFARLREATEITAADIAKWRADHQKAYADAGLTELFNGMTDKDVAGEVLADRIGEELQDGKLFERIMREDASLFKRIVEAIKDFLSRYKGDHRTELEKILPNVLKEALKGGETKIDEVERQMADKRYPISKDWKDWARSLVKPQEQAAPQAGQKIGKHTQAISELFKERGITDENGNPYDTVTIQENADMANDIMRNIADARAYLRGEKNLPKGMISTYFLNVMAKYAAENKRSDIAMEILNSPLLTKVSEAAQELRLSQEEYSFITAARTIDKAQKKNWKDPKKRAAKEKATAQKMEKDIHREVIVELGKEYKTESSRKKLKSDLLNLTAAIREKYGKAQETARASIAEARYALSKTIDDLYRAIGDETINVFELARMNPQDRHRLLAEYMGEKAATEWNAGFEEKLLLKYWERAVLRYIKKQTGLDDNIKTEMKSYAEKLAEVFTGKGKFGFLADLAAIRLGTRVTETQAAKLAELAQKVEAARAKYNQTDPKTWENYGLAAYDLLAYTGNLARDSTWQKTAIDILGIPRSMMASADVSALMRQAYAAIALYPRIWSKDAVNSLTVFGQTLAGKNALRLGMAQILGRPNAVSGEYKRVGLSIAQGEEAFPTSLPARIPVIGRLFKASETSYELVLSRMRADIYDYLADQFQENGRTMSLDEKKSLAKYVNSITGKGNISRSFHGRLLNALFFSPQLAWSRIEGSTGYLTTVGFKSGNVAWKLRALGIGTMLSRILMGQLLIMLFSLFTGEDPEKEMISSEWGKGKLGRSRVDLTGGFGKWETLMARLYKEETKSGTTGIRHKINTGEFGSMSRTDLIVRTLTNMLAPNFSMLKHLMDEKNYEGKTPKLWDKGEWNKSIPVQMLMPLTWQNAVELIRHKNPVGRIAILTLLDMLGNSVNTYEYNEDWNIKIDKTDKPTKYLLELRNKVGQKRFNELNKLYNAELNKWLSETIKNPDWMALPDEEKQKQYEKQKKTLRKKYAGEETGKRAGYVTEIPAF